MGFVFLNNTTGRWLAALGIALAVTLVLELVKRILVRHLGAHRRAHRDQAGRHRRGRARVDQAAGAGHPRPVRRQRMLDLPASVRLAITRTAIVTGLIQAAIWGNSALRAWLTEYYQNRAPTRPAPPPLPRSASSRAWCCGS